MPRRANCVAIITMDDATLKEIAGANEITYPQLLKKLWIYWKVRGLNRIEKL